MVPEELTAVERRFLAHQSARFHVSAVSIWEMRLKYHARRPTRDRKSSFEPNEVVAVLSGLRVTFLPMTIRHAARELNAPIEHKDPFDELLLVQAQEERLKLLTADRQLAPHAVAITL